MRDIKPIYESTIIEEFFCRRSITDKDVIVGIGDDAALLDIRRCWSSALRLYDEAIELNPTRSQALGQIAVLYSGLNEVHFCKIHLFFFKKFFI